MLLGLIALSACSKQKEPPPAEINSPTQNASISLRNIYSISLNGGAYVITELENTGKAGITAFQGKWTIKDDLDATVADSEVRFTSDTPYLTPDGDKSPHVISPGETFIIINQGVSGESDKVFAAHIENITNIGILPLTMTLSESKLEDYRVTKKTTFAVEKTVTQ